MVEISLIFVTTISTIIVVTMATIFFCCWRKKGSEDIAEGKSKKQQEVKKEPSPAPATGKPENGVVSQSPSPSAFVESSDDLGDFSAVQRETDILRSYRKPPPPRNRARQSRAPRALKSSTENLDIFTELSEEDNKENIVVKDEFDYASLRPKPEGKDATTRDARSSMLVDIEQTLAAMHQETSGDNSPSKDSEDLKSPAESETEKKIQKDKNQPGKEDQRKSNLSEVAKRTSLASGDTVAPRPTSVPPEVRTTPEKASPKSSPITKPKRGPKVSPKPSPKITAKFSAGAADKPAGSANLTIPADDQDSESLTSSATDFQTADNSSASPELTTSSYTPNQSLSTAYHSSREALITEQESTCEEVITNANTSNSVEEQDQAITETSVTSPSESTPPNLVSSEKRESDASAETTNNNRKPSESAKITDTTKTPADDTAAERESTAEKVNVNGINTDALATGEADGSDGDTPASEPQPDAAAASAAVENHDTQAEPTPNEADTSAEEPDEKSTPTTEHTSRSDIKDEVQPASPEGDGKAHEPKSISPSRTDGTGKQRRESAEDQSGKGKKSKLPVRAGSKTRASPPKTDKPASP